MSCLKFLKEEILQRREESKHSHPLQKEPNKYLGLNLFKTIQNIFFFNKCSFRYIRSKETKKYKMKFG